MKQVNYATTEKELLYIVYEVENVRPYIIGFDIIVYIDHTTIKYLMKK